MNARTVEYSSQYWPYTESTVELDFVLSSIYCAVVHTVVPRNALHQWRLRRQVRFTSSCTVLSTEVSAVPVRVSYCEDRRAVVSDMYGTRTRSMGSSAMRHGRFMFMFKCVK